MIGIYKIQSKVHPERCYIGSAIDIRQRWIRHKNYLKQNKHHSPILQAHFNKYGLSDLQFSVLKECQKAELYEMEQHLIDINKPYFNVCRSVTSPMLGRKASELTKQKHRVNMTGNKNCLGRPQSEEHKRKRAESLRGYKHSEEQNKRQSERLKAAGIVPPSRKGVKIKRKSE